MNTLYMKCVYGEGEVGASKIVQILMTTINVKYYANVAC